MPPLLYHSWQLNQKWGSPGTLNGGARMMHFMSLKETCEALEVACNNAQGWDTIEPLVERVLEEMEQFNEWLAHQE